MLLGLIEITTTSLIDGRPLFASPLEEPYFYSHYFRRWVEEGLAERKKVLAANAAIQAKLGVEVLPPTSLP